MEREGVSSERSALRIEEYESCSVVSIPDTAADGSAGFFTSSSLEQDARAAEEHDDDGSENCGFELF